MHSLAKMYENCGEVILVIFYFNEERLSTKVFDSKVKPHKKEAVNKEYHGTKVNSAFLSLWLVK